MTFIKLLQELEIAIKKNDITSAIALLCRDNDLIGEFFKRINSTDFFIPLEQEGYFDYKNNLKPIKSEKQDSSFSIPYWPAWTYLEKVSKNCLKSKEKEPAEKLMTIIREVTCPDGDSGQKADNWRTWQSFVKILSNLPLKIISIKDCELIAEWLDSKFDTSMVVLEIGKTLLPKFLKFANTKSDFKKIIRIIEIVLNSIKIERRHSTLAHSLQEMFRINSTLIGEKCGKGVLKILKNKIEKIVTEKDDAYCYVWRPAIEDSEQNMSSEEYRYILISGFRNIFLSFASINNASKEIRLFFQSPRCIIRRVSLYILDRLFGKYDYRNTAEKILTENIERIFLESNYHHELYLLIGNNFASFSSQLQTLLIEAICDLSEDWKEDSEKERLNMMLRRRWLSAIKTSGYSLSKELEERYFKDGEYKPEHPEFLSYIGPVSWGGESLFSPNELLAQGSIENIISFLKSFEGKNRFGEIAIREAGQSFKDAIKLKQSFFEGNLLELKKTKYEYWYYVVQAFEELVQDKKEINWDNVLGFCENIVNDDILWDGKEEESQFLFQPKKTWIPKSISALMKKGLKSDDIYLSEDNYKTIDKIIRVLLAKQKSTASEKDDEALTTAINSPKGHVLECFFCFVLRRYRDFEKLEDKGIKEKIVLWKRMEPLLNKEIERTKEGNYEFSSLAGSYLPNLHYLNQDWVALNINKIFPDEEKHWRCAMQGYSYVNTVYTVIYNLLRNNGHLKRALDTRFSNEQTRRRIVENVAISYLRGQEIIDGKDSLFKHILEKWIQGDIETVIGLFWSHRDAELDCEQKERIYAFWRYCFNRIKGKEDANKDILSDLNLLSVFFNEINDDRKKWLMQSILYVEERYHNPFLMEYFNKIADKSPKDIGEIFLSMLDKTMPLYEENNIRSIVEKIYRAGHKNDIANPICDKYARAGVEYLTEIYKKYN